MMKKLFVIWAALTLLVLSVNATSGLNFTDDFTSDPFPTWKQDSTLPSFTWDGISSVSGIGRNYQNITDFDPTQNFKIEMNASYFALAKVISIIISPKTNGLANYQLLSNIGSSQISIKCLGTLCKLNGTQSTVTIPVGTGIGDHLITIELIDGVLFYSVDNLPVGNVAVRFDNTTYNSLELYLSTNNVSVDMITLTQTISCTPNWVASVWSSCTLNNGSYEQVQTFSDVNVCGMPETKPADITRSCGKSNNHYGMTTNFEQVADPSNISGAVYETPYGKIAWVNPISIVGVDLDTAILIRADLLYVNKSAVTPSMDSQANVEFQMDRTYDWCVKGFQMYYANDSYSDIKQLAQAYGEGKALKMADKSRIGLDCFDDTVCKAVTCTQSKVGFQAQHFSYFGVEGNGTYVPSDYPVIVADGLGIAGATFVSFMAVIVIVGLVAWGWNKVKKVK